MMRTVAVTPFAVLLAVLTAAGCSTSGQSGSGPTLTVAREKDAVTLDPSLATDGNSLNVTQEVMKGLVQFKPGTYDVEPVIAKSWTTSKDGRTWTFILKKGLTFSDGTPVDAEAVKFNFDRWRLISSPYHANSAFPYYASMFGGFPGLIANVEAPAPDRVVFTLTRPFAPFLRDLAMPPFAIGSAQAIRDGLGDFAKRPVGYGPYSFVSWVKNDRITLHANPAYPVKPAYSTVVLRVMNQADSLDAIRAGRVDVIADLRPQDALQLDQAPGVTVYLQPGNNTSYLAMNMDRAPFDRLGVRRAIANALDVRGMVKSLFPKGAIVADNWMPPGMLGDNPAVKAYPFDISKAKAELAGAGLPNGFETNLFYPTVPRPYLPEPERTARAIAAQLGAIGIKVDLQPYEWGTFLEKVHNGEHAMCLVGWVGDNGDPDNFLYTLLDRDAAHRPNAQNYSFWRDPQFHDLMIAGQTTSDSAKRAAIYQKATALIAEMVPAIPIAHMAVPVAVRSSIGGFVADPDTHIAFELLYPKDGSK